MLTTAFTKACRVGWAPLAVVGLHAVLAAVVGHRRELDPVFHVAGGAAGAFTVLKAIAFFPRELSSLALWNRGVVAFAAVALTALLWECGEFVSDYVFGSSVQAGWWDTSMDLLLGAGGALVGVLVSADRRRNAGGASRPA